MRISEYITLSAVVFPAWFLVLGHFGLSFHDYFSNLPIIQLLKLSEELESIFCQLKRHTFGSSKATSILRHVSAQGRGIALQCPKEKKT